MAQPLAYQSTNRPSQRNRCLKLKMVINPEPGPAAEVSVGDNPACYRDDRWVAAGDPLYSRALPPMEHS